MPTAVDARRTQASRIPRPRHVDKLRAAVRRNGDPSREGSPPPSPEEALAREHSIDARECSIASSLKRREQALRAQEKDAKERLERCALWEQALTRREQTLLVQEDGVRQREEAITRLNEADEMLRRARSGSASSAEISTKDSSPRALTKA
eukprot:2793117-Prymnesium_polylepis.1